MLETVHTPSMGSGQKLAPTRNPRVSEAYEEKVNRLWRELVKTARPSFQAPA